MMRRRPGRSSARDNSGGLLSGALVLGFFGLLICLERRRPLRSHVESSNRHDLRNLAFASLTGAAVQIVERPLIMPLVAAVERNRLGLLPRLKLPVWAERIAGFVLLDYTLYLWHILTHRIPFLWRFHRVHHADLDLGASTGIRFHFGEILISVAYRAGQVLLLGTGPKTYSAWNTALLLEVMFHHSNVDLPLPLERFLNRFVVTPRMHGIHHSIVPGEANSNWSSGLTIWDRIHGTLHLGIPQEEITIGLPAYRDPSAVTLPKIVAMPFRDNSDSWKLPEHGSSGSAAPSGEGAAARR